MVFLQLVLALLAIFIAAFYLIRRQFAYWQNRGVPNIKPMFPYGNLKGVGTEIHTCQLLQDTYTKLKHLGPFAGIHFFFIRVAVLTDLDLIKNVLIKESHLFSGRQSYHNERDDPLSAHLFAIDGPKWKSLRTKFTPTFTSGKMKYMFSTVTDVGDRLVNRLMEASGEQKSLEMKDFWARYSTDVIGSCAFGIECNTLNSKNAQFREMGRIIFEEPRNGQMFQSTLNQVQSLGRFFRIKSLPTKSTEFFRNIVQQTIEHREAARSKNEPERKDFMSILIEMKNRDASNGADPLSLDEIAAQSLIFFLAGFETSSSLLSFCSYELALHQDIQEKARAEIEKVLSRHNGELTYDAMMEMTYCDMVLNEALRKYPPLTSLTRATKNDYHVADSNIFIPAGVTTFIPVYAIHHDPDIYPEPQKFIPERFTHEEIQKRHPMSFLPFGNGPRNCIGLRFGMMQARIGLVSVLRNFRFKVDPRMSVPLKLTTNQFIIASQEGIWLQMEKINA